MVESKLSIPAFALLITSVANAQSAPIQYVCIVQHVASLHYDEKAATWAANEAQPGRKYALRRLTEDEAPQPYLLLPSFLGGGLGLVTSLANTDKSLPIGATRLHTRPRRTSWTYRNALFLESAKPYQSRQNPLNLVGASSV
jgi:hypothetical protein